MILDQENAEDRLNSANNLINRLNLAVRSNKKSDSGAASQVMRIPQPSSFDQQSPVLPPSADEIIDNIEHKLKMATAHDTALDVLVDTVNLLKHNLVNIDPTKPERLSRIATDMAKVAHVIDEVRNGNGKNNHGAPTIIYKPLMLQESNYQIIQVHE